MMVQISGFEIQKNVLGKSYLCFSVSNKAVFEAFAQSWLQAYENQFCLRWSVNDTGQHYQAYSNITGALTLAEFKESRQALAAVSELLIRTVSALSAVEESLLDPLRLILDPELIFIFPVRNRRGKTAYHLRLTYLPFKDGTQDGQTAADYEAEKKALLAYFVREIVSRRKLRRDRGRNTALLAALEEGSQALDEEIRRQFPESFPEESLFGEISGGGSSDEDKAEADGSSSPDRGRGLSRLASRAEAVRNRADLPLILLASVFLILLLIYIFDKFMNPMPPGLLIFFTALLALAALWQMILLFVPASPYSIFQKNFIGKEVEDTMLHEASLCQEAELHPLAEERSAVLTLLNYRYEAKKRRVWQIFQQEFLIGGDKERCNLFLQGLADDGGIVLRICQRGGVFYAQALSSTEAVYLEERLMYRYEDYQLPDDCRIKIKQLLFRFKAY